MTNKEVIKVIEELMIACTPDSKYYEAGRRAIEALKAEPCDVFDEYGNYKYPSDVELTEPNTATSMPCEDVISRQAAIDEIRFGQSYVTKISPTGAIEHLFDKENKALEEAVERIEELPSVNPQPKTDSWSIKDVADTFKKHGLIREQEPKTGHWITTRTFMHDGEFYCDKCKCEAPNNEKWDYCPNCGCRMVEPQESEGEE